MMKMNNKKKSRLLTIMMTVGSLFLCVSNVAYATGGGDPLTVVNNLSEFIFIIQANSYCSIFSSTICLLIVIFLLPHLAKMI